jgi:hypothetical protein
MRTKRQDATEELWFQVNAAAGNPIFDVGGVELFYQGKTSNGDLVWQAESEPMQIIFVAPDFEFTDVVTGLDNMRVCVKPS